MAKNLKLKINNSQLAKALEIKKVKLSSAGKKKAASKAKPVTTAEEEPKLKARILPPKAKVVKKTTPAINDIPEELREPTSEVKTDVNTKVEKDTLSISEKEISQSEQTKEEDPSEKRVIGQIVIRKEKPKAKTTKEPAKTEADKKSKAEETSSTKTAATTTPKKASPTSVKPFKTEKEAQKPFSAKDFKAKKLDSFRTFNSRSRHGFGEMENERWRKKRNAKNSNQRNAIPIIRPDQLSIQLPISIKDLASQMKLKASEIIKNLFKQGIPTTLNDYLDDETTVQLLGQEFRCEISIDRTEEKRIQITDETIKEEIKATPENELDNRPPIITFMGHVDHGKTSIIDYIRNSKIAAGEAGAITQHIGAFTAKTSLGRITILDTPGHEAFSEMRARGANVTDIAIIVIAGDEGIRDQTLEAIAQAKESKATIIVALNKSDKDGFDSEKIYRQLSEQELMPEAWGGNTITVNCSAITGDGIKELLEMISLQAEVLELRAAPKSRARGTVLESQMHKGMGAIATVLIQNGTLKLNDAFVFGENYGRVKTMQDQYGKNLKEAPPSTPVKITGLSSLAKAGSSIIVVADEKEAKAISKERTEDSKRNKLSKAKKASLESLLEKNVEKKIFPIIIRADVQGSLEALEKALLKIKSNKIDVNIISAEVGEISESDIELAAAANAVLLGFHTRVESHADSLIKQLKIKILLHDIIYHAIDEVKLLMKDKLDKLPEEKDSGKAQVLTIFKSSHLGKIAGCLVNEGTIKRGQNARLRRKDEVIWTGKIASLKRVKDDVKEVQKGVECGILLENFSEVLENDIIESFDITYLDQDL